MKERSLNIINEYLQSSKMPLQKNALSALAALNSEASLSMIAETAVTASDRELVSHAEALLFNLEQPSASQLTSFFGAMLDNEEISDKAYYLLGRMRANGCYVPLPNLSLRRRAGLSKTVFFSHYPLRDWSFRLRSLIPGWIGGAAGLAVYMTVVYLLLEIDLTEDADNMAVASWFFGAPFLAIIGTCRTAPINIFYDRIAALLPGMKRAAFWGVIVAILGWIEASDSGNYWLVYLGIVLPLFCMAIRGGTILGAALFSGTWRRFGQTVIGVVIGWLLLTGLAELMLQLPMSLFEEAIANQWNLFSISGFGLAYAYSIIDEQLPAREAITGPVGKRISYAFLVLIAVLGLWLKWPYDSPISITAGSGVLLEKPMQITRLPTHVNFLVEKEIRVRVTLEVPGDYDSLYQLRLFKDEKPLVLEERTPGSFAVLLKPGSYRIVVSLAGESRELEYYALLPLLMHRLWHRTALEQGKPLLLTIHFLSSDE